MRRNRTKLVSLHLQTGTDSFQLTSCISYCLSLCSAGSPQCGLIVCLKWRSLRVVFFICSGSGLITPGGFSSVPAGMETPELIELRKKKIEEAIDG